MTDTLTYFYFISFSIWPEHQVDANFIHKLLSIVILFNLSCGIYSVAVRFLLKLADILQSFPVPTAVIVLHARSSSSTVKSVILSKEVVSRKVEKSEVISSNQVRLIYHLCFILLILFGTKLCYAIMLHALLNYILNYNFYIMMKSYPYCVVDPIKHAKKPGDCQPQPDNGGSQEEGRSGERKDVLPHGSGRDRSG